MLSALLKKKYLVPRSELQLDWKPLFELFQVFISPINHIENNVTCYSIGRTLVRQFEGCWRLLKVLRPRSSLSSRWGVLKNMECTSSVSFWTWGFQVSRGYFTDESTSEMLAKWTHMLCPADRSSFWINCNNHHDHNFVWVKVSEAEVNISFYVPIRIHIAT